MRIRHSVVGILLIAAGLAACEPAESTAPSPERSVASASSPIPAVLTAEAAKSMDYLGTCGWEFPAALTTMADGVQAKPSHQWGAVSSKAKITKVTELTLGERDLLRVSFECTIGRDVWRGDHLVAEVEGAPVDLGLIAAADTEITVEVSGDELKVSYAYQRKHESNAERTGKASYRVVLVGNTPIRLYGDQSIDDVDESVAELPAQGWFAGQVGMYGFDYDPDDGIWFPGVLTEQDVVITPGALGAYNSSCLGPTTYTTAGEKLPLKEMHFIGPSKTELTGTQVDLAKPSTAPVGIIESGFTTDAERTGLLVESQGRVPIIGTALDQGAELAPEETVVISPAVDDEAMFNGRTSSETTEPGGVSSFLDWDATVLMMGIWYNTKLTEGEIRRHGMLPMPDLDQVHDEAVCQKNGAR